MLPGPEGLIWLVADSAPTSCSTRSSARAGLGPTIVALTEGIDVALANKESLVVGGELVTALAEATGARLIPIDSEHTALHHLLTGEPPGVVERLIITASGGPFRGRKDLQGVTVEEALNHPTWSMGGKITIDSATLMNKGLELMEAHHLFGTPYDRIDVVVHPQSIIHALVQLCDGSTKAHMGYPDMRVAIGYALHHPDRADLPIEPLDLIKLGRLDFEEPDLGASRACASPARPRSPAAPRRARSTPPTRSPSTPSSTAGSVRRHPGRDRVRARPARHASRARLRGPLRHRLRGPRPRRRADRERERQSMSWLRDQEALALEEHRAR